MSGYPFHADPPYYWEPMGAGWGPAPAPFHPHHHPHGEHRPHYHGFCYSCCHPMSQCMCGCRECRKEAKELLVAARERGKEANAQRIATLLHTVGGPAEEEEAKADVEAEGPVAKAAVVSDDMLGAIRQLKVGTGAAFIGGGCCVHLSVEYTLQGKGSGVIVLVTDSDGTVLAWGKLGRAPGYYIKEDIISTNPGARLQVLVVDAIARVRWCEVFSC